MVSIVNNIPVGGGGGGELKATLLYTSPSTSASSKDEVITNEANKYCMFKVEIQTATNLSSYTYFGVFENVEGSHSIVLVPYLLAGQAVVSRIFVVDKSGEGKLTLGNGYYNNGIADYYGKVLRVWGYTGEIETAP